MTTKTSVDSDAQLVEWTLAGDGGAFVTIVERYQSLVCSIAYNATGSLSLSEDLAQETFLAAWRQLSDLREPARLRSWLCGIVRFLVGKEYRSQRREPIHAAETLDSVQEPPSRAASPATEAISREEEAILWRALERIPYVYREPLILFYRGEKSIERVAAELELSEDAVKQRLSRGRKLVHEEVTAFVEGTLSRTAPGQRFSSSVLAMLPAAPPGIDGQGLAGKGSTLMKSSHAAAWLTYLGPLAGVVAGLLANWLSSAAAATARERRLQRLSFIGLLIFSIAWCWSGQIAMRTLCHRFAWSTQAFVWAMTGFWSFYAAVAAMFTIFFARRVRSLRWQIEQEPGVAELTGTPLTARSTFVVLLGVYVASFSWLILLALRAHDRSWAAVLAGFMTILFLWHFLRVRRRIGAASLQGAAGHVAVAWAIILLVVNLRLQHWLAPLMGVTPGEMRRLFPVWVAPSTTLLLILMVSIVAFLSRAQGAPSAYPKR